MLPLAPPHRNREQGWNNGDKDKDKKGKKNERGRSPKKNNDKKEGNGNGKKGNDTTPKKVIIVKTEKSKNNDKVPSTATPVFTHQRAWVKKSNNDDTNSTNEIESEVDEVEGDTFLEELFNTPWTVWDSLILHLMMQHNDYLNFLGRDIIQLCIIKLLKGVDIVKV